MARLSLVVVLALAVAATGCGGTDDGGTGALPAAHVAVWSGPEADNLRDVAAAYQQATGNEVVVEEIAREGYQDKLNVAMVGKSEDYDAAYASADWLPSWVAAEALKPLDDFIGDAGTKAGFLNTDDLKPGIGILTIDGKVYGFPSEGDTAWLFYREDLLKEAGLQPPQTMDELLAAAKKLTTPERKGLVIGARRDEIQWDFMHYFFAFGARFYDPDSYEVEVNSPQAVEALQFYSDLLRRWKVVSPDVTTFGYNEILTSLQQDKAAMGVEWMAATGDLTSCDKSPKICEAIKYELVPPAEPGAYGFGASQWGWVIPVAAENPEAGYKFIEWLVGGDGAKRWALNGGIPSNAKALSAPEVVEKVPQFELLSEAQPYRHILPVTTVSEAINNAFADAASAAVTGAKSPQQALDEAAERIETALRDGGYLS